MRGSTTLLDSTVVKLRFRVSGVAPGSVLVPVWIPTVVLRQIGLRMSPWVYPGKSHTSIKGIQTSNKCFSPQVGGTSSPACNLFLCTLVFPKRINIKPSGIESAFSTSFNWFELFVNLQQL